MDADPVLKDPDLGVPRDAESEELHVEDHQGLVENYRDFLENMGRVRATEDE